MKKLMTVLLGALSLLTTGLSQTVPLYEIYGTALYRYDSLNNDVYLPPPVIDASVFNNYGYFQITNAINFDYYSPWFKPGLPFEPSNLQEFGNSGTMEALFGFRFENSSDAGRRPMSKWVNQNTGVIRGTSSMVNDGNDLFYFFDNDGFIYFAGSGFTLRTNATVIVRATNIVNEGLIQVNNRGKILIEGENVDLSYGSIGIAPETSDGCQYGGGIKKQGSYFDPALGIIDSHWLMETNTRVLSTMILATNIISSPDYWYWYLRPPVLPLPYYTNLFLTNYQSFVYGQRFGGSNITFSVVLIKNEDTNVQSTVRFAPTTPYPYPVPWIINPYRVPIIEFSNQEFDPASGGNVTNKIWFLNSQAGYPNNNQYMTNSTSGFTDGGFSSQTAMPGNYTVSRTEPCEYLLGDESNTTFTPALLYSGSYFTNGALIATSIYDYMVTNVAETLPTGVALSNTLARIDIVANNLKMDQAAVRGEGLVSIRANHIVTSENSSVSVPHENLFVGLTNKQTLKIQGLAADQANRMVGRVRSWSGLYTNWVGVPGADGTINVGFHVWLVDNEMSSKVPVQVHELFATNGAALEIHDRLRVSDHLYADATSLTVSPEGSLTLLDPLNGLQTTNFPNVKEFVEILGAVSAPSDINFKGTATSSLARFSNSGTLSGSSHTLAAKQLVNAGTITTIRPNQVGGPIRIFGENTTFTNSTTTSAGELRVEAGSISLAGTNVLTAGSLVLLNVTNSLSDGGSAFGANTVAFTNGIQLTLGKGATGGLLGTTLNSLVPRGKNVKHYWGAPDLGAVTSGFSSGASVPVGRLVLNAADNRSTLATFNPLSTSVPNALYVDYLELDGAFATNYATMIKVDPNMRVYFAGSNLSAEQISNTVQSIPALAGRLVWVGSVTNGVNSSVVVPRLDGSSSRMNAAVRYSTTIDSDGDGIVNADDAYPLDLPPAAPEPKFFTVTTSGASINLSWRAVVGKIYTVEYSTSLGNGAATKWVVVKNVLASDTHPTITVTNPGTGQRFYRVRYQP